MFETYQLLLSQLGLTEEFLLKKINFVKCFENGEIYGFQRRRQDIQDYDSITGMHIKDINIA